MAVPTSVLEIVNDFQSVDKNSRKNLLDAISGPVGASGTAYGDKSLRVNILGQPDFVYKCVTDTNTATAPVFNLTTLGVPFDNAETLRKIRLEAFTSDNNSSGYHETVALIRGGTAPALDGSFSVASGIAISTERVTARVQANEVIINAQGPSGVPVRWVIRCFVGEPIKVPFLG